MWYNPSIGPEPHSLSLLWKQYKARTSALLLSRIHLVLCQCANAITISQPVIIPNCQNPSMTKILASNSIASSAVVLIQQVMSNV